MEPHESDSNSHEPPLDIGNPPSELLTSKFLRKTKFRRKSMPSESAEPLSEAEMADVEAQMAVDTSIPSKEQPSPASQSDEINSTPGASPKVQQPTLDEVASTASETETETLATGVSGLEGESTPHLPSTTTSPPPPSSVQSIASSRPPPLRNAARLFPEFPEISPEDRIRFSQPEFPLSKEELDQAKSLILDLLGWGVDPEYLVTSGLSPVVVFRVFTDLHLRLPSNLELTKREEAIAYP